MLYLNSPPTNDNEGAFPRLRKMESDCKFIANPRKKERGSSKESRGRIVIIGVSGKAAKSLTLEVAIESAIGETRNDYGERDRATTSR